MTRNPYQFGDAFDSERDPLVDPETGARIPDELTDAILDDDISRAESQRLFRSLAGRPHEARDVAETERALEALRRPVDCPDFTKRVLAQVDHHRRWLAPGGLRRVSIMRIAATVGLLAIVAGGYVTQRIAPAAITLADRPAPVSDLAASVSRETAGILSPLERAMEALRGGGMEGQRNSRSVTLLRDRASSGDTAADARLWLSSVSSRPVESAHGASSLNDAGSSLASRMPSGRQTDSAPNAAQDVILVLPGR
ncbi:MAG TPA: hypothetical protein VG797_10125 [Phycisphaerales bacterium]|nr:hypothetical protein [Phycisphaerales bacterium]